MTVPTPLHWAAMAMADAELAYAQHERSPEWTPQGRADRYAVLVGARNAYRAALDHAAHLEEPASTGKARETSETLADNSRQETGD